MTNNQIFVNARFLTQKVTGTQRFAIELSKRMKNQMPRLIFLAPNNIVHKDIADELEVEIVGNSKNGIIWEQFDLPLYLKNIDSPLLLNLCNTAPLIYNNNVVSIMDISYRIHPEWFSRSFELYYNFLIPKIIKKAKHVITISKNTKTDIVNSFKTNPSKIDIVYPGVPEVFLNSMKNIETNKFGSYLLAVSSQDPRKNFAGLIQAFVQCNFNDIKLVIVGDSNSLFANPRLNEHITRNANIVFTGYLEDSELVSLYNHAIAFVYPSFFEGFGIPPLEAMACSCPTIVSNTTSIPEVCGDASIYVNPYDIDSIADGLRLVVEDEKLRCELILKGIERVKLFDWNKSSVEMLAILNNVNKSL